MKAMRFFVPAILATLPTPASATIRAVFVGIDKYAYSTTEPGKEGFKDLRGAVNDARTIKRKLGATYQIKFDSDVEGTCSTMNALSITLVDKCATKKAIFAAWDRQIAASKGGDTLILYFAGHGSQIIDSSDTQASGRSDTILAHDSRKPNTGPDGDIVDRQILDKIDRATARGINVVTIFDSCNSGTATRDPVLEGESRAAPRLVVRGGGSGIRGDTPPVTEGTRGFRGFGLGNQELKQAAGYRVHFAAAADGEDAREVGAVGQRSGVFTSAFTDAIGAMPHAAFVDIATEVKLRVGLNGRNAQHPQAEGALTASMGGKEGRGPLYPLKTEGGQVWLQGGQASGVTAGSIFALFDDATSALATAPRELAQTTVARVEPYRAALQFDGGTAPSLKPTAVALEKRHAFGEQVLRVRNGATGADAGKLAVLLNALSFVTVAEPPTVAIVALAGKYDLVRADGGRIASLGALSDSNFPGDLERALTKVARVQALIALRTGAGSDFCLSRDLDADIYACDPSTRTAEPVLELGKVAKLIAINSADEPRHLYVYAIDDDYEVKLALPIRGGSDTPLKRGKRIFADGNPNARGHLTFLTLSTTEPINASVLEQSGLNAREASPAFCEISNLARALCAAQKGRRDAAVPAVRDWDATVVTATVK